MAKISTNKINNSPSTIKSKKSKANKNIKVEVPLRKSTRKHQPLSDTQKKEKPPKSIEKLSKKSTKITSENNPIKKICEKISSIKPTINHKNLDARLVCSYCNESLKTEHEQIKHTELHHKNDAPECIICKNVFDDADKLLLHIRYHFKKDNKSKPFQCNICQDLFDEIQNLENHVRNHLTEESYKCLRCPGREFWDKETLFKHFQEVHIDWSPIYICRYCKTEFQIQTEFIEHDEKHTNVKPYDCSVCGESFDSFALLNEHKRLHDKQYNCNQCWRGFNRSEDLHNHLRIHKGLSVFECQLCDRMFAQSKSFSNHIQIAHSESFFPHELPLISIVVDTKLKEIKANEKSLEKLQVNLEADESGDGKLGKLYKWDIIDLIKKNLRKSPPPLVPMKSSEEVIEPNGIDELEIESKISLPSNAIISPLRIITKTGTIQTNLKRKYQCPLCQLIFVKILTLEIHCKRNHSGKYVMDELRKIEKSVEEHEQIQATEEDNQQNSINKDNFVTEQICNKYNCPSCKDTFSSRSELIHHIKIDHKGDKPFKCNKCEIVFECSKSLSDHVQSHSEIGKKCKYCGATFVQRHSLVKHIKRHEGPNVHNCSVCNVPYREQKDLKKHMRIHAEGKPHKCDFCDKRFVQSCDKIKHLRIHTGERPYACKICGKTFAHLTSIKKHELVHTGERPHQCTVCGKSFQHNSNLVVHMRVHTGERPYKCNICDRAFYASGHLADHLRMHAGVKNFKCELCGKSFLHQSSYHKHKRTHSGEKPYHCLSCDRRFSQPGHFKEHMRIHTGEKPFTCPVCTKTFRRMDSMQTHLKTHSSKKNLKNKKNENIEIQDAEPVVVESSNQILNQINEVEKVVQVQSNEHIQLIATDVSMQPNQNQQNNPNHVTSVRLPEYVKIEQISLLNADGTSTIAALVQPNQSGVFNTFNYNIVL